jgi:hypothetical protein
MSYVPPHLRNRKNPAVKEQPKVIESDFPAFVVEKTRSGFNGPTFREKMMEASKVDISLEREHKPAVFKPMFSSFSRNIISKEEEEEEREEEEYVPEPDLNSETKNDDDGWHTVERKVRVKRDRVQEALDNGDAPLEEDEEETSWNDQQEEHETYWDERRH